MISDIDLGAWLSDHTKSLVRIEHRLERMEEASPDCWSRVSLAAIGERPKYQPTLWQMFVLLLAVNGGLVLWVVAIVAGHRSCP